MKPITQYTPQECLDAIRRGNYLNRHEIADRIERLVNIRTTPAHPKIDESTEKGDSKLSPTAKTRETPQ